ncbi:cadherin repeat domain-containing protein [Caulifigura coniformis]|nr:cadherin repeat domain-containing protein [Caulifigura coniformis]
MSGSNRLRFGTGKLLGLMGRGWEFPRIRQVRHGSLTTVSSLEARVLLSSTPAGGEFQVSPSTQPSATTGLTGQTIAFADDGSFASIWTAWHEEYGSDVTYLQRFDAEGAPLGQATIVNGYPFGANNVGTIAMKGDGSFVVAWWNPSEDFIAARRFDATGAPLGGDIVVSQIHTDVSSATVAISDDGSFVVSWVYGYQTGPVMARIYDPQGQALGNEFEIGTSSTGDSSVAMSAAGDFVVTWTAPDGGGDGIFGQRYNAAGSAVGSVFRINGETANDQRDSSVVMNPDGSFIVVWTSTAQDGDGDGIYARRYEADGDPAGPEFRVNTTTAQSQNQPAVATAGEAGFVVSWTGIGADGFDREIFAQWYDSTGAPLDEEVRVNSTTEGIQWFSAVAMASDGATVVNWSGVANGQPAVLGQRYRRNNEAPTDITLTGDSVLEGLPAGTVVGTLSGTDADASETFTYSLVPGAGSTGNANFEIVGNELRTAAVFDFETQASYSVRVRVTDSFGESFDKIFTIQVSDGVAPETTLSNQTVAENRPRGTVVGSFAVNDVIDAKIRYTLVNGEGGSGNRYFSIVGNELRTKSRFNFEGVSSYSIRVRVRGSDGYEQIKVFTIHVTDVNESPTSLKLSSTRAEVGQPAHAVVGQLSATDVDAGEVLTYSLVSGRGDRDNASFRIVGDTLQTATTLPPGGRSSLTIRVRVTDSAGNWFERTFTIKADRSRQLA